VGRYENSGWVGYGSSGSGEGAVVAFSLGYAVPQSSVSFINEVTVNQDCGSPWQLRL
jgi:hypothetical protein